MMNDGYPHPADIREPVSKPDNHVGGPMHPIEMIDRIRRNSYTQLNSPAGGFPQRAPHPAMSHENVAWEHRDPGETVREVPFSRQWNAAGSQLDNAEAVRRSPAPATYDSPPHHLAADSLLSYVAGRLGVDAWSALLDEYRRLRGSL
jgi:hypothetical protein